jgi:hypothetical protein
MSSFIRHAPMGVFLAMVLRPLGLAAAAAFAGWRARRQATLLTATPSTLIGMTTDGYRQLRGQVEAVAGETLRAPLTGAPCCWYEARVERWTRATSTSKQFFWETVRSVTSSAPLLVRDATGVCTVHVYGAEVTPADQSQWSGATLEPEDRNPPRHGSVGAPTGVLEIGGRRQSVYRYTEARIYAGDPLLVLGRFTNRRFEAPDDEVFEDDDAADLSATSAGVPSIDAWAATDTERTDALTTRAAALTPFEIAAGAAGEPLILSTTSESGHVAMADMHREAGFTIAVALLALVALVLYTRFG